MGMRRLPEAGSGSATAIRVSAGNAEWSEANRVGARPSDRRAVSQIFGQRREHRAAGEVFRAEGVRVQRMVRSDGARGGCIPDAGSRTKDGGRKWRVIRE